MGRELQKRKNRSSVPKVRRKPKTKKNPLSNPIIAKHWNPRETLSQNYRRLGLAAKLNAPTGGVAPSHAATGPANDDDDADGPSTTTRPHGALAIPSASDRLVPTETRVERDEAGRIVRVVEEPVGRPNPLNDPLNDLSDSDPEALDLDDPAIAPGIARTGRTVGDEDETSVVQELRMHAGRGARKAPRKPSARECEWIERLVQAHGDNYGKMMWDRKLNPMQQSEGDIKRRVTQWKQWKESTGAAEA